MTYLLSLWPFLISAWSFTLGWMGQKYITPLSSAPHQEAGYFIRKSKLLTFLIPFNPEMKRLNLWWVYHESRLAATFLHPAPTHRLDVLAQMCHVENPGAPTPLTSAHLNGYLTGKEVIQAGSCHSIHPGPSTVAQKFCQQEEAVHSFEGTDFT